MEKLSLVYDSFYCSGAANRSKMCICKICDESFGKISRLREHLLWHMNNNLSFNDLNLKEKQYLFDKTHTNVQNETNENLRSLIQDKLKLNLSKRFYQILNCNSWELNLSDSETESESEESGTFQARNEYICSKCNVSFDRVHKIIFHMKHAHILTDFDHKCVHCSKIYPNSITLDKHIQSQCGNDIKDFKCNICKIKFMWQESLEAHTDKMHLKASVSRKIDKSKPKVKSYICDICSKSFFRAEHLERHRKIHIPAEKKFSCDLCKKKFNRKDNLK